LKSEDKSLRTLALSSRFQVFSCSRHLDGLRLLGFCRLDLLSQKKMNFSVLVRLIGATTCGRGVYGACAMTRTRVL